MAYLTHAELEQRVLDGLPSELELFGTASESGRMIRREGLVASVCLATPERSLFNSIYAKDLEVLRRELGELEGTYRAAGVRAWMVWLRGGDPLGPGLLEPRGYVLDGSPRSMGLELSQLRPPTSPLPAPVTLLGGDIREAGQINDRAYGHAGPAWATALTRPPTVPIAWVIATWDGEPVACAAAIESGDDAQVTGVATVPERRGHNLAGHLIHALLVEAEGRGARTATLQASRAGAPVYERLGFEDVGCCDLWERRTT